MDRLIDRICFPSKYIEIEYNKWFLIINFDNSRSRRLSEREYKMFCQLKHKNKIVVYLKQLVDKGFIIEDKK